MAGYAIRPLVELSQRARKYFTQAIDGAIASVWPNTFTIEAKVLALLDFEHEQRRAWLFRQQFASTADAAWLQRHGFELGLSPDAGLPAIGSVLIPAPNGLLVPAELGFVREDGLTFTAITGGRAAAGVVRLYIEADAVGAAGNTPAGARLALAFDSVAPAGLGAAALVEADADGAGLTGGTDAEDLEVFRARVLARKRNPPHGGNAADYETWLREAVPTAQGVWVDSFSNDTRAIWVAFTVTDTATGLPSAAQLARAQAYLDDPVRRPVTARAFAVALDPVPVPVTIGGLAPDTPAIRANIASELAAAFIDRAEPGQPTRGASLFSRSWLNEAVSRATGEDRHRLVSPADDLRFTAGRFPVLGPITYTA